MLIKDFNIITLEIEAMYRVMMSLKRTSAKYTMKIKNMIKKIQISSIR